MGLLRWIFGRQPVKPASPPDPNKVVEAGRVPTWHAPIVLSLLAERGVRASSADVSMAHGTRLPLTQWPHSIIYVLEPDQAAASAFITSFLSQERADDDFDDLEEFESEFDDEIDL